MEHIDETFGYQVLKLTMQQWLYARQHQRVRSRREPDNDPRNFDEGRSLTERSRYRCENEIRTHSRGDSRFTGRKSKPGSKPFERCVHGALQKPARLVYQTSSLSLWERLCLQSFGSRGVSWVYERGSGVISGRAK
jgi:hypothetical protein